MQLIQIVSRLPPAVSGVGDYALLLARQLRDAHGIDTKFVLTDSDWSGDPQLEGFDVQQLPRRTAKDLLKIVNDDCVGPVLMHYVGYAYAPKGCPFWLIRALEHWQLQRTQNTSAQFPRLLVMFHELYATGPLWNSAGITSSIQKWLTRRLARIADVCFTNRRRSALELEKMRASSEPEVKVFPVFSNFGDAPNRAALAKRGSQAVWFGGIGRGAKDRVTGLNRLRAAVGKLAISKVVAVGCKGMNFETLGIPIEQHSVLSREAVTHVLSQSRIGILDYYDGYLGKSGIFAAYCSHGLMPLLVAANASELDGLQSGRHFLVAASLKDSPPPANLQQIADAASTWYASHDLARTSSAFAAALNEEKSTPRPEALAALS